jgi:hypothetical protein
MERWAAEVGLPGARQCQADPLAVFGRRMLMGVSEEMVGTIEEE